MAPNIFRQRGKVASSSSIITASPLPKRPPCKTKIQIHLVSALNIRLALIPSKRRMMYLPQLCEKKSTLLLFTFVICYFIKRLFASLWKRCKIGKKEKKKKETMMVLIFYQINSLHCVTFKTLLNGTARPPSLTWFAIWMSRRDLSTTGIQTSNKSGAPISSKDLFGSMRKRKR